ncbi:MAG TPA: diguanylate cyclase [Solirubrobacteraceae bacterium]|nr:diguanylate cyclase [Solirubrobacteraceae bacterium]
MHVKPPGAQVDTGMMSRRVSNHAPLLCAVLGIMLAVLGASLVASRRSSERAETDRALDTTAGEKAALVETDLERLRALAVITAHVPPFSELYADSGSLAAKIAAVAGPFREINNALYYVYQTSPERFVEVSYVDASGRENALVVRGVRTSRLKLRDVRSWPSFREGVSTPVGKVGITMPFLSPAARVPVIAGTTGVAVNGSRRAYVELELALPALQRVLSSDLPRGMSVEIATRNGTRLLTVGPPVRPPAGDLRSGLRTAGRLRLDVRAISDSSVAGAPWFIVSATRNPSMLSAVAPEHIVIVLLAFLLFVSALIGFRRDRAIRVAELASADAARAEADRLARIDGLTGLFNRRHAMETIEHELARASRQDHAVALLLFDVDFFKRINDTYGHMTGDAVLTEIARRLRSGVRSWDTVARMGGEEFCVIAPEIESELAAAELADRLRVAVAERGIEVGVGIAIAVSVSVGVAVLHSDAGSAEHALDCADRALYAAKRRGRDRVCRFSQLDQRDLRAEQPECVHVAEALASAGDLRGGVGSSHSRDIADLSADVARRLDLGQEEILRAQLGGWLHDIGKIAVPDNVLTKPAKLTDEEWALMRTHPVVGDELLRNFPELALACRAVRHHHERWDGAGYPDRLAAEQIPLEGRIVGAVDAYLAMIRKRPWQEPRTAHGAIAELKRCAGTQFDPIVVEALLDVLDARAEVPTAVETA